MLHWNIYTIMVRSVGKLYIYFFAYMLYFLFLSFHIVTCYNFSLMSKIFLQPYIFVVIITVVFSVNSNKLQGFVLLFINHTFFFSSIVFLWDSNKKSSTSTHLSGRSQNDGRKINHESRRRSKRHPEWGWFALTRRLRSRALAEHTDREFRRRINSQQATQAPRT